MIDDRDIIDRIMDYDSCNDSDVDEAAEEIQKFRNKISDLQHKIDELETPSFYWDNEFVGNIQYDIYDVMLPFDIGNVVEITPVHILPTIKVIKTTTGWDYYSE